MDKIKLLVVDDEIDFLDTVVTRLQIRGFNVFKAPDGDSALEIISKEVFDVVILDLKMPGLNGEDVLKEIKKTNPKTEVIILTAHGAEEAAKLTMGLGAFCFITKPVEIDKLTNVINLALDKGNI